MKLLHKVFGRLRRSESGVVGPAVAVLATSLLAAGGLALDVGLYYMGTRDLRSATEAAALSAAVVPTNAQQRAAEYLVRNGYPASVLKSVTLGYYCANTNGGYQPGSRFVAAGNLSDCPGSSVRNAVQITTGKTARRFLTGLLGGASPIPDLSATASAARIDEVGVAATSDILRLTEGRVTSALVSSVNGLLGALLNIQLRLSDPDILALMSRNVDAGKFFDALAAGERITYLEVTSRTYGMQEIALAAASATDDAAAAAALRTFGNAAGNGIKVPLNNLFGLGVWRNMPAGESMAKPGLRAGLNAYQLILFAAQAGPTAIDASELTSLVLPKSTVRIAAVANGPMSQPRFSFGPAGETTVSTSQLRLQVLLGLPDVSISLLGLPRLLGVTSVPLLVDVGPASARVTDISCNQTDYQSRDTTVKVETQSGFVRAYIGQLPTGIMDKQMAAVPALNPVQLLDVNLLNVIRVTATAKVDVGTLTGARGELTFGPNGQGTIGTPNMPGRSAGISNNSQIAETLRSVIANLSGGGLDVKVSLLNNLLSISTQQIANGLLNDLLGGLTTALLDLIGSAVDPLLDSVLAALGIQLGDGRVWVTGARCGVPVLI